MLEIVLEAKKWIGVKERGANSGPEVERFQRSVDGVAQGEPWCMAFVQYCISQVEWRDRVDSPVFKSEHCLTVWNRSPEVLRMKHPAPGAIVIWQHGSSSRGHTGIVSRVIDTNWFETIEGNTSGRPGIDREGDGVFEKARTVGGAGDMRVVGFLRPFL